jgi:Zn-finger protein
MTLVISCEDCTMQHSTHCRDCVVTAICDEPAHAVIIDAAEERAVRMLARAGLVPVLQHRPQSTCA